MPHELPVWRRLRTSSRCGFASVSHFDDPVELDLIGRQTHLQTARSPLPRGLLLAGLEKNGSRLGRTLHVHRYGLGFVHFRVLIPIGRTVDHMHEPVVAARAQVDGNPRWRVNQQGVLG